MYDVTNLTNLTNSHSNVITFSDEPHSNEAPSIASSAMLVTFSISVWGARKTDKKARAQLASQNHAKDSALSVTKRLVDSEILDKITQCRTEARQYHYSRTLPWSDAGSRLLTTVNYFDYTKVMSEYQNQFYKLVDEFVQEYYVEILKAQATLGNMFDSSVYPDSDEVRAKFGMRLSYEPVPEAGDFRVDVGNSAMAELRDSYESAYEQRIQSAMGDIWRRLYDKLANASERLDLDADGKKRKFHDTLVSNVVELIDVMRTCNITGDAQMTAMADKLEDIFRGVSPQTLRDDTFKREETKRQVDKVLAQLPSLDF